MIFYYELPSGNLQLFDEVNESNVKQIKQEKPKVDRTETITCQCGASYSRSNKARHLKSKEHLQFMEL